MTARHSAGRTGTGRSGSIKKTEIIKIMILLPMRTAAPRIAVQARPGSTAQGRAILTRAHARTAHEASHSRPLSPAVANVARPFFSKILDSDDIFSASFFVLELSTAPHAVTRYFLLLPAASAAETRDAAMLLIRNLWLRQRTLESLVTSPPRSHIRRKEGRSMCCTNDPMAAR